MTRQPTDIILSKRALELLRYIIDSRGIVVEVFIFGAVVRRVEPGTGRGKSLYALELRGMARRTRRMFASHFLGRKRMFLRKFKIPPFLLGGSRGFQRATPAPPSAALGKGPPYLSAWPA